MTAIGQVRWAVPAGFMPLHATGWEPDFTSRAEISVLNTADSAAALSLWVYFEDQAPVGPFCFQVGARRKRVVRFNDLIDPQALPLEVPFSAVLEASGPVVVQFTRQETPRAAHALTGTLAFPVPDAPLS